MPDPRVVGHSGSDDAGPVIDYFWCVETCSTDDDCVVASWPTAPYKCIESSCTMWWCDTDADCTPAPSDWWYMSDCTSTAACDTGSQGRKCIDVGSGDAGKCIMSVPNPSCISPMTSYEATEFSTGNAVTICANTTYRCQQDAYGGNWCNEPVTCDSLGCDGTTPDCNDATDPPRCECNDTSCTDVGYTACVNDGTDGKRCVCANDADCAARTDTGHETRPHCDTTTRLCGCSDDSDCTIVGYSSCINGHCGCAGDTDCAARTEAGHETRPHCYALGACGCNGDTQCSGAVRVSEGTSSTCERYGT